VPVLDASRVPDWPSDIHHRVRAARGYRGLSLERLADAVEIGRNTLSRTEGGKRLPKRGEIWEIALVCQLPYEFFIADFSRLAEISREAQPDLAALRAELDEPEPGEPGAEDRRNEVEPGSG
jgi:transcriptional regulator with XRE-family HTH domain